MSKTRGTFLGTLMSMLESEWRRALDEKIRINSGRGEVGGTPIASPHRAGRYWLARYLENAFFEWNREVFGADIRNADLTTNIPNNETEMPLLQGTVSEFSSFTPAWDPLPIIFAVEILYWILWLRKRTRPLWISVYNHWQTKGPLRLFLRKVKENNRLHKIREQSRYCYASWDIIKYGRLLISSCPLNGLPWTLLTGYLKLH